MARWFRLVVCLLASALVFYLLNYSQGMVPPLGRFANPFAGFWQNGSGLDRPPSLLELNELQDSVVVVWDERQVPHIFAANDHDLYFAQGYVTAHQRLWQMEFQILAAAGRLSEIIGPQMLEYDRYCRRAGLPWAAERTYEKMMQVPEAREAVEAYAGGVNAYIESLDERRLPLEYKLLDYRPEPWSALNAAMLLKQMASDLTTYHIDEESLTRLRSEFGEEFIEEFYPVTPPFTEPIIPGDTRSSAGRRRQLSATGSHLPWDTPYSHFHHRSTTAEREYSGQKQRQPVALGSNNWAVAAERTADGFPILCSDPHLGLHVPAVWYEAQLFSPTVNVYGVTLPGVPGVVIGFNENVAWGMTNAETDVLDWYHIEYEDESRTSYRHGGSWRPIGIRVEEIKVRGGDLVVDTTRFTHHGPVVCEADKSPYTGYIPVDAAMRWVGHEPSAEILALLELNRAEDYEDFVAALSHYSCPAQNFAFACRDGDIAIWHNGRIPVRRENQGRYLLDGSDSTLDWQGFIPHEQLPHIRNPESGYVCSANQRPVTEDYPYFLSGNYAPYCRSSRIIEELRGNDQVAVADMMSLQNDVLNLCVRNLLPVMLPLLDTTVFDSVQSYCYNQLRDWDFRYQVEADAPTIAGYWWKDTRELIWSDDLEGHTWFPRDDVTEALLLESPASDYIDDSSTPEQETLADIVNSSFRLAISRLVDDLGPPDSSWQWGRAQPLRIEHLMGIPGLGLEPLPANGWLSTVNATARRYGPSWRMIVELGTEIRAWGIYPGGQSGNPGSPYYDNAVADWLAGDYFTLTFLEATEQGVGSAQKTIMRGKH